jgi:hypothetical protein
MAEHGRAHCVRDVFQSNEENMGSTPNGIADPVTAIGPALPQDIEIERAGLQQALGRVRVMVAPA